MSMTGLSTFDTTVHETNIWVNEVAAELGTDDKQRAFQGLRVALHVLRDRLTVEEAAHLGAQLPVLLAGFYYEDWKLASNPSKERSKDEFLGHIRDYFQNIDPSIDAEAVARATFKVLSQHVTKGEMEDVIQMMPAELKDLFPKAVRA